MAIVQRGALVSHPKAVVEMHGWNTKAGNVTENAKRVKNYFFRAKEAGERISLPRVKV
jgi:hypothetical protein